MSIGLFTATQSVATTACQCWQCINDAGVKVMSGFSLEQSNSRAKYCRPVLKWRKTWLEPENIKYAFLPPRRLHHVYVSWISCEYGFRRFIIMSILGIIQQRAGILGLQSMGSSNMNVNIFNIQVFPVCRKSQFVDFTQESMHAKTVYNQGKRSGFPEMQRDSANYWLVF